MGAQATITGEVWAMAKSTKRKAQKKFHDVVNTDVFVGDERAKVTRNIHLTVKGGQYNDISLGSSATVQLTCNQDDGTIQHGLEIAEKFAEEAIKRYHPAQEKVVKKLVDDKDY
jgi:hypothetical protein